MHGATSIWCFAALLLPSAASSVLHPVPSLSRKAQPRTRRHRHSPATNRLKERARRAEDLLSTIPVADTSPNGPELEMFRGCGLFSCARRGRGNLRKRGELGGASSRVAPAEPEPEPVCVDDDAEDSGAAPARQLAWAEVETATGGFSSKVVGRGGFSTVYLASLPSSRLGAVKIHCSSERLHRAFRRELDVLLSLRHPHIVRLLGYCDERDEGVLVFEYAPNGDLHEALHGGALPLPWARRVAVAFQVATALEYLHDGRGDKAVIHGDIKASNVLLDASMDAKLCDFGFAHVGVSATMGGGGGRPSDRAVMGSPGYVDPHLLRSGVATKKSDVYSFGVLMLELLTGKEAVCRETGHRLTAAVRPQLGDGHVSDVLDQRLGGDYDVAEAAAVAELAMKCVSDSPGLRPSMVDVVRVLQEKTSAAGSRLDHKMVS